MFFLIPKFHYFYISQYALELNYQMAKQKNTVNKKLHSKLMDQKKNKKQQEKEKNKLRLRELYQKANQLNNSDSEN